MYQRYRLKFLCCCFLGWHSCVYCVIWNATQHKTNIPSIQRQKTQWITYQRRFTEIHNVFDVHTEKTGKYIVLNLHFFSNKVTLTNFFSKNVCESNFPQFQQSHCTVWKLRKCVVMSEIYPHFKINFVKSKQDCYDGVQKDSLFRHQHTNPAIVYFSGIKIFVIFYKISVKTTFDCW